MSCRSAASERACSSFGARPGGWTHEHVQFRAQPLRGAPGAPHEPLCARLRLDQGQQPLADRRCRGHDVAARDHLVGDLAQRGLAQRGQVLDPEEAVERGVDALGRVHPALAQPAQQRLGRDVDEHDLVGLLQRLVGQRLAHTHAAVLGRAVVERLQVLDVERREDVDAGLEHVLDVLVALAVLDPGRVGVRELVDQAQLRRAGEDGRAGPARSSPCRGRRACAAARARGPRPAPRSRAARASPTARSRCHAHPAAPSWSIR